MKASAFEYRRARSVAQACEWLSSRDGARLLAGGQSLLPAMNMRLATPSLLIDITNIDELRGITTAAGVLRIGALVRHVELLRSAEVAKHAPLLTQAIAHVAHPAIRNRGTIGGNLAHADPASELPACMLVLDAAMIASGPQGERRIAAGDFFRGVFETALAADEMLIAIEVPVAKPAQRFSFMELARRSGDYAIAGLACSATHDGGKLRDVKLGFFAVGDRPVLAIGAAAALAVDSDAAAVEAAKSALAQDLEPQDDLQGSAALRLHLSRVMLERSVASLLGQQTGGAT
jgi:carbon-monoxide dehydrogenase medium subunit